MSWLSPALTRNLLAIAVIITFIVAVPRQSVLMFWQPYNTVMIANW